MDQMTDGIPEEIIIDPVICYECPYRGYAFDHVPVCKYHGKRAIRHLTEKPNWCRIQSITLNLREVSHESTRRGKTPA